MTIDARAARTPANAMDATATASRPIPAVDESFAAATANAIATRTPRTRVGVHRIDAATISAATAARP